MMPQPFNAKFTPSITCIIRYLNTLLSSFSAFCIITSPFSYSAKSSIDVVPNLRNKVATTLSLASNMQALLLSTL